jgi:hypothetical protein
MAKQLDDFDEKYYRQWSHELPPYKHLETGVTLDIHHNLLPGSAGKSIDIDDIINTKHATDSDLYLPNDAYLILHSAIHLLLNDDIEKGFRDCIDLHYMLLEYQQNYNLHILENTFEKARCLKEFYIMLILLQRLFKDATNTYTKERLTSKALNKYLSLAKDLEKAVFPSTPYLANSSNEFARLKVYIRGHLSKMPLHLFIKHIAFKGYRTIAKKLLGEYVFKKQQSEKTKHTA